MSEFQLPKINISNHPQNFYKKHIHGNQFPAKASPACEVKVLDLKPSWILIGFLFSTATNTILLQVTERFYANKKDQVIQAVTFFIPKRWRSLNHLKGSRITIPKKVTLNHLGYDH